MNTFSNQFISLSLRVFSIAIISVTVVFGQTKVFILSGQSNMVGFGRVSDLGDLTPYTYPNISIYSAVEGQTSLTYSPTLSPGNTGITLKTYGSTFGPEFGVANALSRQFPNEHLIFIKVAFGATSLQDNWLKDVPVNGILIYPWFKNMVKSAIDKITEPKILCGMIWMQGEADASFPNMAPAYANNLKIFVEKIRSEHGFGVPAPAYLPFVYGKIQNAPLKTGDNIWPYGSMVQNQQASAQSTIENVLFTTNTADANATVWPFEDAENPEIAETGINKRHYNSEGQKHVGLALGNAMVELLTGTAITAKFPYNWDFGQPSPFTTIAGDFTGDKIVDYARISSTLYFNFLNNGNGTFSGQAVSYPFRWDFGLPSNFTTITGDFNGDGKVDYARLSSTCYFVFISNGNGSFSASQQNYPSGWDFGLPSNYTTITGDFNGDGKMDYARLSSTCYFVFMSVGNGTFIPTLQNYPNSWDFGLPSSFTSVSGDFNNDGKTDYARLSSTCYFVFLSNGNATFSASQQNYPSNWNFGLPSLFTTVTGNFDGKNGIDIARIDGTHVYYSLSDGNGGFYPSVQYFPVGYNFGALPLAYSVIPGSATSTTKSSLIMLGGTYFHVITRLP